MIPGGVLSIILLIVVCETTAITCVKKYHDSDGSHYLLFAVILYAIICMLLSHSLDYKDSMGVINVVWAGMSIFIVTLSGVLFFEEEIKIQDVLAGALISTGVMMLKISAAVE